MLHGDMHKNVTGNTEAVSGIQSKKKKNHILHHEVHPQNLVAHWVIIHPCFSMTEFLSVEMTGVISSKRKMEAKALRIPSIPHQWQRQGLTVNKLKSKDTVLNKYCTTRIYSLNKY